MDTGFLEASPRLCADHVLAQSSSSGLNVCHLLHATPSSCSQRFSLHYCFSSIPQHSIQTGLAAGITTLLPFPPLCLYPSLLCACYSNAKGQLSWLRRNFKSPPSSLQSNPERSFLNFCSIANPLWHSSLQSNGHALRFFYQNLNSVRKREPVVR